MLILNLYTSVLFNLIINRYFSNQRCLLIFSDFGFDYDGSMPSLRLKIVNGLINSDLIYRNVGCQGIVIHSEDPIPVFEQFETEMRDGIERFNNRRYLIIVKNATKQFEKRFFDLKQLYYACDLLLAVPRSSENGKKEMTFDLKTHKYVGVSTHNEPLLLDRWFSKNQTFLFGANLYPDKLKNQLGRPLRMACMTYEPYSVIGNSTEEHQGSELVSVINFAFKHNMTPVLKIAKDGYWGDVFPNWTGTGVMGKVVEDKADIGFFSFVAALSTWDSALRHLDFAKPSVRTGVTCLVPAPKRVARWLTPLVSFPPQVWFCAIATALISISILSLVALFYNRSRIMSQKYSQRTRKHFFRTAANAVLKPLLLQPLAKSEIPRETASKFLTGLSLALSLVLTSIYCSGLASVMTLIKYEPAVDTVHDFVKSGLEWGATDEAWITSIQNAEEPDYVKVVQRFRTLSPEELHNFSKRGHFGFGIERLPRSNFAIGSYVGRDVIEKLHIMKEDFYYAYCLMMVRKNSVLLEILDSFLLRVTEAGLINKWQNEAVEKSMDSHVQRVVKYGKQDQFRKEVVKLKWSHVRGAFAILMLGYGISFVIFILELSKNKKRSKYC